MGLLSGSFEQAARVLFDDLPEEAIITSAMEGGQEYQLGDYTWDTEDRIIVIEAYLPPALVNKKNSPFRKHRGKVWRREFHDLPSLWEALHPGGET